MKTTLEELRNNNIGYTLGKDGITEADLQLVNGIICKIEQTRTRKPQPLDAVEYTNSFGCYYPNAIIDGDTYRNGSAALCECGSAYVSVSDDGSLCKSVSGGAFQVIDKDKLRYIGKKEKHYEYCDRANRCNGDCGHCDDATCENNPLYKLKTRKENN